MNGNTTVTEAIIIPLLKAVISAVLVGLFVITAFGLWRAVTGWRLFWFVASAVCLAVWAQSFIGQQNSARNYAFGPPDVSMPPPPLQQPTKVEIIAKDPQSVYMAGRFMELPLPIEKVGDVAREYNLCQNFSLDSMAGPGKPLSRNEFVLLRDKFIERGLAYWVNEQAHAQGVALTLAGEALLRRVLSLGSAHANASVRAENMGISYD